MNEPLDMNNKKITNVLADANDDSSGATFKYVKAQASQAHVTSVLCK